MQPHPTNPGEAILGGLVIVGVIYFFLSGGTALDQFRLAFTYNIAPWKIVVNKYPDDECSFWHVPGGHKDCYHEEIIRTFDWRGVQVEPDSGRVDSVTVSWGGKVSR